MYVLKIKTGENKGKFVGKKGIRSWDWKPQEDVNNARIFLSIGGIKAFWGKHHPKGAMEILNENWKKDRDTKKYKTETKKLEIPYTEYYEAMEIKLYEIKEENEKI